MENLETVNWLDVEAALIRVARGETNNDDANLLRTSIRRLAFDSKNEEALVIIAPAQYYGNDHG